MNGRSAIATAAIGAAALLLVWSVTHGFRVFTTETARRFAILESAVAVPVVLVEDQTGRVRNLDAHRGRILLVDFIYTRCATLCSSLGLTFRQLRAVVDGAGLGDRVQFVSISFDPRHDDPAALRAYLRRYGVEAGGWQAVRIPDPTQLRDVLRRFGVVVIPDGRGGFAHNAAIHLVDAEQRLVGIFDLRDTRGILAALARLGAGT